MSFEYFILQVQAGTKCAITVIMSYRYRMSSTFDASNTESVNGCTALLHAMNCDYEYMRF